MVRIKNIFAVGVLTALFLPFCFINAKADAVCNMNISPKNAGVGEEINVRIEFTNENMDLLNAKATLEYDSGIIEVSENSQIQGAGGVIALSDMAGDAPSIEFNVTFVAKNVGSSDIVLSNASVTNTDGDTSAVSDVSDSVTVSQEGGFVSDSKLQSLEISHGSFTKGFSPEVTSYEVNVENDVTSIEITAQMSSVKSYIYFSGFDNDNISFVEGSSPRIYVAKTQLAEGDNVKKITVEAENGEETVYTVNIIRLKKDEIAPIEPDVPKDDDSKTDDAQGNMNIFQSVSTTTAKKNNAKNPNDDNVLEKIFPVFIVVVFGVAVILLLVVFVAKINAEKQNKKRRRPAQNRQNSTQRSTSYQNTPRTQQPKKAVVRKKNSNVRRPK